MSEKQQLADEFRSVDSLRDHMIRELPWFRDCYPRLYAETNELLQAGVGMIFTLFHVADKTSEALNLTEGPSLGSPCLHWMHAMIWQNKGQFVVDLDYVSIFDIVNARNMPEERRQDLYRLWVFAAVDREIGRHERPVKRILEQKQLGGVPNVKSLWG